MSDKVIIESGGKLVTIMFRHWTLYLIATTPNKYVIKLLILVLLHLILFLIDIRLKKCVINLLILALSYLILFLIDIRLKKCVNVSHNPFMLKHLLDRYQILFVPDWFVTSTMIKKHDDALFANNDIIFINKDSNNATFLVVK